MHKKANHLFVLAAVSCAAAVFLCMFSHKTVPGVWQRSEGTLLPMDKLQDRDDLPVEWQQKHPEPVVEITDKIPAAASAPDVERNAVSSVANPAGEGKNVFLQLQYLPLENSFVHSHGSQVNGVALGYFLAQKDVSGFSMAFSHLNNGKKSGVSLSFFDECSESSGLALSMIGRRSRNHGLAVGVLNVSENNRGIQLGLVNHSERMTEDDEKTADGKNAAENFGVQTGLINYSDAAGIQFGLWNTNPNGLIKHFPFFNICL